jgi:deoxyribodipyrimidine photo-lyase
VVNIKRVRNLKKGHPANGWVLYWMSRDQRVNDNWALSYAIEVAENEESPVMVIFNLADKFLGSTWRQYDFLLKGLKKVEAGLSALNIPFMVLLGDPAAVIPQFIRQHHISRVIVDFDPLRIKRHWQKEVIRQVDIRVDEVDAHNIVPCYLVSDKEEYAASTFRPKITRLLPEFLDEYPPLIRQHENFHTHRINWEAIAITLKTDYTVRPVEWLTPGEKGALAVLGKFLEGSMGVYADKRNDPNEKHVSGLSPYLHYGHISAQRVALEIIRNYPRSEHTEAFLEELIVRRELSDNFCFYNSEYDKVSAFRPWALKTLNDHRSDQREYVYSAEQFERALTHDTLWNAAQIQMVYTGTMPGYMRMYWAKKILEWSDNPEEALRIALQLNDRYQLDGRDPNGYAGCAWSIGGVHDRAWGERMVFGKIRYMNRKGCERKFDVNRYITRINKLVRNQSKSASLL